MGLCHFSLCYGKFICDFQVIHFTLGETNIKASRGQASHSQKSATFPFDKSAKNVKDNGPKTK